MSLYEVSFGGDEVFWEQVVVTVAQLWEYIKHQQNIHFKKVTFMGCEWLCLNNKIRK